jgi:hypothetical protein
MSRAPEAVDKAVDAVRRAERTLVGSAEDVAAMTRKSAEDVAAKTRKTRRKLARKAKATRKDLAKSAKKAKTNVQQLTGTEPKRSRRWPWIVGLLVAALGAAAVVRSKASTQTEDAAAPEPSSEDEAKPESKQQENGRPQPAKPVTQPKK